MKTQRAIASLLPTGSLVLSLLVPFGAWAADEEAKPQSKASFGDVIERQLPAPDFAVPQQVLLDLDQHLAVPKPERGPGATLVFKTREGGVGVMQLLGFSAKPEPILKLRYKLVRHPLQKPVSGPHH